MYIQGGINMEMLGKACAACGTSRKVKNLRYDPNTFLGYCENPYICNSDHPNAPAKVHLRGIKGEQGEIFLTSLAEAENFYREKLMIDEPNSEKVQLIKRVLESPVSVRITSPDVAKFLVELHDEFGFKTISETVRYCVQALKESKDGYYNDYKKIEQDHQEEVKVQEFVKELEQEVNEPKEEPKQEAEEESELTF